MADAVASGVLNSLLDKMRDRITNEFGWLTDIGAELKKMEGTLSTIRDVLEDAEERQVWEKALTGWLRRLKDVAYDFNDLLDEDFAKNLKRSAPESSTSWMKGKEQSVSMKNMTPHLYHVMDGCHDLTTTPSGLGCYAVFEECCYFVPAEKFERSSAYSLELSGLKLEDQLINRSPRGTPGYAGSKATLRKNFVKQSEKYLILL